MAHDFTPEGFCKRVESVIESRFHGNTANLVRKCQNINKDVTANAVYTMLRRRSFVRIDIAATIALAAGVSLDWLAGIEKATADESTVADLAKEAMGHNPRSVEFEPSPDFSILPGYAFGSPGEEQVIIDFLVRGKDNRHTIPFGQHRAKPDKEA